LRRTEYGPAGFTLIYEEPLVDNQIKSGMFHKEEWNVLVKLTGISTRLISDDIL